MILKATDVLASSRTVKAFAWGDNVQPSIAEAFEASTGIKLELTTFGSNDEAKSTMRANGGKGFDIVFPSITNSANSVGDNGESFFAKTPAGVHVGDVI